MVIILPQDIPRFIVAVLQNDATSGWMSIDLSPQFTCNGSNLAILIVKGYQAYTFNYPNWTYTTTTTTRVRCNHSDSAAPTSLTGSTSLPNLQIKIFPTPGILFPPQKQFNCRSG